MKNSAMVKDFMRAFDQRLDENMFDESPVIGRLIASRLRHIVEEVAELERAVESFAFWNTPENLKLFSVGADAELRKQSQVKAFVEVIDALANVLYMTYGFALAFGIDLEEAFLAVHASNMSKLDEYGQPIYREDGRVLKGPCYRPPDFTPVIRRYFDIGAA